MDDSDYQDPIEAARPPKTFIEDDDMKTMAETIEQSAVIPFRVGADGRIEVALITSAGGKAWIVPKGIVDPGESPRESAERECLEEAGLIGEIEDDPIGSFSYEKWGSVCEVAVFVMRVTRELVDWEEAETRDRQWLPLERAAERVREVEVGAMIRELSAIFRM